MGNPDCLEKKNSHRTQGRKTTIIKDKMIREVRGERKKNLGKREALRKVFQERLKKKPKGQEEKKKKIPFTRKRKKVRGDKEPLVKRKGARKQASRRQLQEIKTQAYNFFRGGQQKRGRGS